MERVLSGLPSELARQLREAIRHHVEGERAAVSGPRLGVSVERDPEPGDYVPGDGDDAGPVAGQAERGEKKAVLT